MDPPDARRATPGGGCHARCLYHPGPHPSRLHREDAWLWKRREHAPAAARLSIYPLPPRCRGIPLSVDPREPASLLVDYLLGGVSRARTFMVAFVARQDISDSSAGCRFATIQSRLLMRLTRAGGDDHGDDHGDHQPSTDGRPRRRVSVVLEPPRVAEKRVRGCARADAKESA